MTDEPGQEYGVVVNATRVQIEEFKESILWADIRRELLVWSSGFDVEMKNIVDDSSPNPSTGATPSTASVLLHMGDLNGRMKAIEYVLSILDVFLDIKEGIKEDN